MASSSEITTPSNFSFPNPFMSFSDLLAEDYPSTTTTAAAVSRGLSDRITERTGSGVPKFKSIPPPSLPLSPPPVSPSSYFAIPAGLSPAELLDSPVLLSSSNILPSPTTGSFPIQRFNWKSNSNNHNQDIKQERKNYSDFSFHTRTRPPTTSSTTTFHSQVVPTRVWSNLNWVPCSRPTHPRIPQFRPILKATTMGFNQIIISLTSHHL
ncbi:hypothetical protein CsSME_00016135 [Camellia sinensis var. sinensis]